MKRITKCALCTLIVGVPLLTIFAPESQAIGYLERLHCDYIFSESHFTDINRKDYPRCEKRWDYLIARIMKYHP